MPYLEFEQQLRSLGPGVLTIGSGTEARWRIPDRDLAPLHAIVTPGSDGRAIIARGSPGATIFVNEMEVEADRALLGFGDTVRLGIARFTYRQTAGRSGGNEGYLRDTRRGRVFQLSEVIEIGRDPRCGILVQEAEVSRVHAEVRRAEDGFVVYAMAGAFTMLNGDRLYAPTRLREGDELMLGRTLFRFSTEPPPGPLAPVPPGGHLVVDARGAQMKTVFTGAIEARERVRYQHSRRIALITGVVASFLFLVGALLAR